MFLLLSSVAASAQQDNNRTDGNAWTRLDYAAKLNYVGGVFDGMILGNHLSYWAWTDAKGNLDSAKVVPATQSFSELTTKYFSHVTAGQLISGLDAFYGDYRNRRIMLYDAIWLVVNEISGKSDAEMSKMIESYRRNVH